MMHSTTTTGTIGTLHNGPICQTCRTPYVGTHKCSPEQIIAQITRLQKLLLDAAGWAEPTDRTRNCPCRTGNGGSGVCGCVLAGPRITCKAAS